MHRPEQTVALVMLVTLIWLHPCQADRPRYYCEGSTVVLWLKPGEYVTATKDATGWQLDPSVRLVDETWLDIVNPGGQVDRWKAWQAFLDRLQLGKDQELAIRAPLYAVASLAGTGADSTVKLTIRQVTTGNTLTMVLRRTEEGWKIGGVANPLLVVANLLDLQDANSTVTTLRHALKADQIAASQFWDLWVSRLLDRSTESAHFLPYAGLSGTHILKIERTAVVAPLRPVSSAELQSRLHPKETGQHPVVRWWRQLGSRWPMLTLATVVVVVLVLVLWGPARRTGTRALARLARLRGLLSRSARQQAGRGATAARASADEMVSCILDQLLAAVQRRSQQVAGTHPLVGSVLEWVADEMRTAVALGEVTARVETGAGPTPEVRSPQPVDLREYELLKSVTEAAINCYGRANEPDLDIPRELAVPASFERLAARTRSWLQTELLWSLRDLVHGIEDRDARLEATNAECRQLRQEGNTLREELERLQHRLRRTEEQLGGTTQERERFSRELAEALEAKKTMATAFAELEHKLRALNSDRSAYLEAVRFVSQLADHIQRGQRHALTYYREPETTSIIGYLAYYSLTQLLLALADHDESKRLGMLANLDLIAETLASIDELSPVRSAIAESEPTMRAWWGQAPKGEGDRLDKALFSRILGRLEQMSERIHLAPFCYGAGKDGTMYLVS